MNFWPPTLRAGLGAKRAVKELGGTGAIKASNSAVYQAPFLSCGISKSYLSDMCIACW